MKMLSTLVLALTAFVLAGCDQSGQTESPTPQTVNSVSHADTNTAAKTDAADPAELIFVFQKQKDPAAVQAAADKLAGFMTSELSIPVKTFVPTNYSATVQALVSSKADIAYVSAIPFLLARRDGGATLLLAEQRIDIAGTPRTDYDSVYVVRADSPLKTYEDLANQTRQLRIAFTSRTSTSGYVLPYARFVKEGKLKAGEDIATIFASVDYAGGYDLALQQVLQGRADVCAVSHYTVEGDKTGIYLKPEELSQLRILERTPGVPTHLVCARAGLSDSLRERIIAALLKLSDTHPDLLADVYGAKTFVRVDENKHIAAAAFAMESLGEPLEKFAN